MAKSPRQQTFADLVQEPTWSETDASRSGQNPPRHGAFNAASEFFDPDGINLRLLTEDAEQDEAQAVVDAGATVVFEGCGCGGASSGCTPPWVTENQLRGLRQGPAPSFTGRHGAPTWIDVWTNDHGTVVFAHGDVSWGSALT